MDKNILVTGGAGYIATHTEVELLNRGFNVIAFDNMVNSCDESIKRVEKITGKKIKFYNADMRDRAAMEKIFSENEIDSVIHFAGLKAVGESVRKKAARILRQQYLRHARASRNNARARRKENRVLLFRDRLRHARKTAARRGLLALHDQPIRLDQTYARNGHERPLHFR